jgi:hypothetical protein
MFHQSRPGVTVTVDMAVVSQKYHTHTSLLQFNHLSQHPTDPQRWCYLN